MMLLALQGLMLMRSVASAHHFRGIQQIYVTAAVARRLCIVDVHPDGIVSFEACCLIPLNKNPGVRPIGIGEVPQQIVAKVILKIVRDDVQAAAGPLQTCAELEA